MNPLEEQSLINAAGKAVMSPAMWALSILGKPQQMAFEAIAGEAAERLRGSKGYISGRDLLRHGGLAGQENTWGNAIAGTTVDLLADPLNAVGIGVLSKAGSAVRKAGTLGRVGDVLTRGAKAGAALDPAVASRIAKAAGKTGRALESFSDAELVGMPLLRPRAANRFGTIRQLEKVAAKGVDVPGLENIRKTLGRSANPDALMDMPFGRDVGIGLPFMDPIVSFNVPGGAYLRDAMDVAVKGVKGSLPGRAARSFFDKDVGGSIDELSQNIVSGTRRLADDAAMSARRTAAGQAAALHGSDDAAKIFSEAGNYDLAQMIEKPKGVYDNALGTVVKSGDTISNSLSQSPAVRKYVDWWEDAAKQELIESKALGVTAETLDDPNLGGYLPRRVSPLLQKYAEKQPDLRSALDATTPDMLRRSEAAKVPGGRNVLSFVLAKDKRLVGSKRTLTSDDEAADAIGQVLYGDPKASRKKTMELARLLHRLPDDTVTEAPLFGQHPTETITQYVEGRARAKQTAASQLEAVASHATDHANPGGVPSAPVNEILGRLGLKSGDGYGASERMRELLAKKTGASADSINLHQFHVPEELYNALRTPVAGTIQDTGVLAGVASYWQAIWRNAILSWPSRYVRDLLGGLYSNAVVRALSVRGMSLANDIMKNGAFDESVAKRIAGMPHYQGMKPSVAAEQFYADLAATQLTTGGKRLDRGVAGEAVTEMFPGADKPGSGALVQMFKEYGETLKNITGIFNPESQFSIHGAKVGDLSDTFNRLSGYTELMLQGHAPESAAEIMKRTHVDYSSLSEREKQLRNNFIPFYTFASRMLGEQARRIIEDPAMTKGALSLLTAPQRYGSENDAAMPEYIGEKFGFRLPGDQGESKTYGYNADFPGLEQLGLIRSLAEGDLGDTIDRTAGMLNPLYKMAAENITGTEVGPGKRPLDMKRGNLARALNAGPNPLLQWADRGLEMVPLGARAGNLARELMSDDGRSTQGKIGQALLNNLTGFKVKTVDRQDQLYNALNREEKRLQQGGYLRSGNTRYVPKGMVEKMPEDDRRRVDRRQAILKAIGSRKNLTRGLSNPG